LADMNIARQEYLTSHGDDLLTRLLCLRHVPFAVSRLQKSSTGFCLTRSSTRRSIAVDSENQLMADLFGKYSLAGCCKAVIRLGKWSLVRGWPHGALQGPLPRANR